jgi:multicomponent Na+:H+ antiporter subunit G
MITIILYLLSGVFLSFGAFFLLTGSIGLLRLPDFYSRAHSTAVGDTLGVMLTIAGLLFTEIAQLVPHFSMGIVINCVKLFIIMIFIGLTNPTATNAIVKAAYHFRLNPWFKPGHPAQEPKPGQKIEKEEKE